MEVEISLKPPSFSGRPAPLRKYRDLEAVNAEQQRQISTIGNKIAALEQIYKEVSVRDHTRQTQAQKTHNVKTNVPLINVYIGSYVMIRTHSKPHYKLQSLWRDPMKIVKSKWNLLFVIEDVGKQRRQVFHAQPMIPYSVAHLGEHASKELREQAAHYDTTYHLVDSIRGVRKRKREFEMLLTWQEIEEGNEEA